MNKENFKFRVVEKDFHVFFPVNENILADFQHRKKFAHENEIAKIEVMESSIRF